jgi:hypothetical protein
MSESVDILIKAEDLATPVIAKSAKAVDGLDANLKKIKQSGEQAKKSTEFFKTIANSFGGSEIGKYAQQLGELTEKTSQFSEVQRLGGAGAIAFKLGVVAAVGAVAVSVGSAFGSMIFETEKWTRKLAEANEEAKRIGVNVQKLQGLLFADDKADIEIIRDPEAKRLAYEQLLGSLDDNLQGVSRQVKESAKEVEVWSNAWFKFGNRAAFADQAKVQLETDRARLEVLREQRQEIARIPLITEREDLGKARDFVKTLQDEVELLQVVEREREKVRALQAIPFAGPEQAEALKLVNLKEQLRVTELIRTETQRLKFEEMQLQAGGKERVDSLKLQEQGLSKEQADRLASEQTRIDRLKQGMEAKPLLQGKDERLLTRGTVDPALKVAKEQLEELKSIGEILAEQEEKKTPTSSESTSFVVVQ